MKLKLPSSSRFKTFLVLVPAVACILIVMAAIWFLAGLRGASGSTQSFTISPGESRVTVARRLAEANIVHSPAHFLIVSYVKGKTMVAGTFTLNPQNGLNSVIDTISSQSKIEQAITIPEGWRREQIAEYLATKGVNKIEFLAATAELEGKLFPDTYYIAMEPKTADIVAKFLNNFESKTGELGLTQDKLILASIVEREAAKDDQRALIAGIYQGRLDDGMNLEADPTVQYGRDNNLLAQGITPNPFWGPITLAQYRSVISSYNTYLNNGLPPGPIANPGIKSIQAAITPQQTTARYFFNTSDGQIITSRTNAEHNVNKAKYLK